MVVDDELQVRRYISHLLTAKGYKVHVAADGLEALNLIKNHIYDAVLLDVKMPKMNGQELFVRLKRMDKHIEEKTIFVTGDIIRTEIKEFITQVNARLVTKPFTQKDLIAEINSVINANNKARPNDVGDAWMEAFN